MTRPLPAALRSVRGMFAGWTKESIVAAAAAIGSVAAGVAAIVYRQGGIDARLINIETAVERIEARLFNGSDSAERHVAGGH